MPEDACVIPEDACFALTDACFALTDACVAPSDACVGASDACVSLKAPVALAELGARRCYEDCRPIKPCGVGALPWCRGRISDNAAAIS